jgi:uncharacterized protein with LGFP repeats
MPSVATLNLADHILRVEVSDGVDNVQINQPGDGSVSVGGIQIAVTGVDGSVTLQDNVTEDQVAEIDVNALRGDDSLAIANAGAAAPIPVVVNGGAITFASSGDALAATSAIQAKYVGLGGAASFLGQPTADEADAPGGGRVATFAGGSIYYTLSGDTWAMSSAVQAKYASLGGVGGFLGQPTADEADAPGGGRVATFTGGAIYLTSSGDTWAMSSPIQAKYNATASMKDAYGRSVQGILGQPISDEGPAANGGRVSHFQGGDIYAISGVEAYALYGAIKDKYNATASMTDAYGQRVLDILKLPTSDEVATAGGGRVVHFQGGDIYANLGVGAYAVYGAIKVRYNALGGPGGLAGLPTSDESAVPGGRVVRFQGADLYAILNVGVYYVKGSIRVEYNKPGVAGVIGLPTTDEIAIAGGWYNNFQQGSIYANGAAPDHQAHEVHGLLRDEWASLGWSDGLLGFPTSDEFTNGNGWEESNFQNGNIYFLGNAGVHLGFDRTQVIGALKKSEADNVLDGGEFNFFHNIATDLQIFVPDSVRNLTHKLIDGDQANATFQGVFVGNLHAGSPAYAVDDLERKWFEGQDHPNDVFNRSVPVTPTNPSGSVTVNGGAYSTVNGPLFGAGGPVYTDIYQGNLGDCTVLASLAEAAALTTTIPGMFTDNGDNTYTVRFFHNGVPDYLTVDRQLPSGGTVFDGPTAGPIWAALAEKAYAQLNESGWLATLATGQNSYGALDTGNGGTVQAALTAFTGQGATTNGTDIGDAWTAGRLIVLGTPNVPPNSLVEHNHAYAVVGYDSSTGQYTLFNPWGVNGGNDTTTGVFKPGVLLGTQAGINQNFAYATWTGSAPVAGEAPPSSVALPVPTPPAAPTDSDHADVPRRPTDPTAVPTAEVAHARPASDPFLSPTDPRAGEHDPVEAAIEKWAVALDI